MRNDSLYELLAIFEDSAVKRNTSERLRENIVEKELRLAVEAAGGLCYKWVSPGNNGVPDRIVVFPMGVICFVELKAKAGKLSPVQKAQLHKLAKIAPMHVYVLYGIPGVIAFLRSHRHNDIADKLEQKYPDGRCGNTIKMETL